MLNSNAETREISNKIEVLLNLLAVENPPPPRRHTRIHKIKIPVSGAVSGPMKA